VESRFIAGRRKAEKQENKTINKREGYVSKNDIAKRESKMKKSKPAGVKEKKSAKNRRKHRKEKTVCNKQTITRRIGKDKTS